MPDSWFWDDAERARFNAVAVEVLPPPAPGQQRSLSVNDVLHVGHVSEVATCDEAIARLREWQQRHVSN